MARPGSPSSFNPYEEDPMFQNSYYTQDISEQMRVPKRIKATGEYFDEAEMLLGNNNGNSWNGYQEKFDMTVPDRIVVIGQEQHHVLGTGTRSAPREIILENSIMKSPEKTTFRVSTPPRSITLDQHHFPSASDEPENSPKDEFGGPIDEEDEEEEEEDELKLARPMELVSLNKDTRLKPNKYFMSKNFHSRESTPPLSQSLMENLTPSEEMMHLRKGIQNLRARVITLELETAQRQQKEKVLYCLGIAYFLMKAFMWLRNN